ncbi:MAG: glycosyltransferase [Methylococcaceae bacterium]|nr:glycosyltransferase [Methylococcaceae bacterium]
MTISSIISHKTETALASSPICCVLNAAQRNDLPLNWRNFLAQQTMHIELVPKENSFFLDFAHLNERTPCSSANLLEQMTWALLAHPEYDRVIWPLFSSINIKLPLQLLALDIHAQAATIQQGFISLSRATIDLEAHTSYKTLCFSHALIASETINEPAPLSFSRTLKNKLSLEQKLFLKRKADALRELLSFPRKNKTTVNKNTLALGKSWSAEFIRPELHLNAEVINHKQRIPVLIATHWLELGGAEKFAIDLIKSLPKERYAIYVTTDIPSFNHWSCDILGQVEAIFHLPSFLPHSMMTIFYEYLIRSRQIRLMHLHHAAQAYEALYHIRRFHPQLQILDSLHIIELPPNEGGYVEASARNFEAFINHHHVISYYLKNFLMQRWRIPEKKISVTYLNVDSDYFNPELIEKGQMRHTLNIPENACVVGFIGRFSTQKQPLEFIKSAQLLQQRWQATQQTQPLIFVMTGSGLLELEIKKAIQGASGTSILLHPQVSDTRPIYQDCDVLMMPSANEGLALVSYEAMAMQTPIFFTDVGAQNELLPAEFLITNTSPLAPKFADAIWPYLIDAEKRQQAGIKMRNYIGENHHHQQTYTELLALYQQLLNGE